jgi:hypothetical protein
MRRLLVLLVALLAVAVAATPAYASGTVIKVPRKFKKALPEVRKNSQIAVRLPSYLDAGIKPRRVRGFVDTVDPGEYHLYLGVGKQCNGATVCTVAWFSGKYGARKTNPEHVKLARGISGRFRDVTCGASCAPASIQWKQKKVRYEIEVKGGSERKMVRLANQAIKAGPR